MTLHEEGTFVKKIHLRNKVIFSVYFKRNDWAKSIL